MTNSPQRKTVQPERLLSSPASSAERAELYLQLLGGFRVAVDDREIDASAWRLRKASHIVKLLALAPNRRLHREQIMELLWPDLSPDAAANNLNHALHVARRQLSAAPDHRERYVHSFAGELILAPDVETWIDVESFEEAAAAAREAGDPRAYHDAIALYGGELLPADRYESWAVTRREELHLLFHSLHLELAQLHEDRGERDLAIEAYQMLVALEPAHEAAHTRLMRLYASMGLRHQALRQYQVLKTALRQELDVEPEPDSARLYQKILAGGFEKAASQPDQTPEAASVDTGRQRHNLPSEVTSFIGREREIEAVRSLLSTSRLLTLTGAGGIGKTRLALAVARGLLDDFPDGVYLISLATINNPDLVALAIFQSMGLQETANQSPLEALKEFLRHRRLLLLLDNTEHLVQVGPQLVELLEQCPDLTILVTSRTPLRLRGEQEYPVTPLGLPEEWWNLEAGTIEDSAAAALFIHRSRETRPDFRVTDDNAGIIAAICRRLDGLPLAIELAAARSKVLPPKLLLAHLDDPLSLLTGGPRDMPARQQTIRDTIAWSYDLLSPGERALFRRLGVFAGGWTLEAANVVGTIAPSTGQNAASGTGQSVLDALTALVDQNLVNQNDGLGEPRFSMLETIREFALEQLASAGEIDAARQQHAEYFLELAEQAGPALLGSEEALWLDRLERELGNLRAVLDWCAQGTGDTALGLRLAGTLWLFWDMRGRFVEGRGWLEMLLRAEPGHTPVQAGALFALGYLATRRGDPSSARVPLEQALRIYREAGERAGESRTLAMLGALASFEGDFNCSSALLEQALGGFRETRDQLGVARTLLDLGDQVRAEGDYDRAQVMLQESLDLFRELGFPRGAGWALANLGNTARATGDFERARELLEESRTIFSALGDKRGLARPVLYLANLARMRGDYVTANALFRESLALLRELEDQWRLPVWLYYIGLLAGQRGEQSLAVRLIAAAEASHERFQTLLDPDERSVGDEAFAQALYALGDDTFATELLAGKKLRLDGAIELALEMIDSC